MYKKPRYALPRTSRINEHYYARNNHPNFSQLAGKAHFVDERGREYTLATQNHQTFQNRRLAYDTNRGPRRCVLNGFGEIKLYVRLPSQHAHWYAGREIGGYLLLREVGDPTQQHAVRLRSCIHTEPKRAGTVTVSGLDEYECNLLLNKDWIY